jgi:hypothetical protein
MQEQPTTAETPVEQPSSESVEDRIAKKFGLTDDPPEQPQPEGQAETAEESSAEPHDPEMLSADEVQPEPSDDLELTHEGKKLRIPKEQAIELAQQGYDYTKKTQAIAEERRALEAEKAAVKARAELTPKLVEAAGKFEAIKSQLDAYQNVDWAVLAAQDPTNYPAHHAQFTKLNNQAQQAYAQLMEVWNGVQTADKKISEADVAKNWNRMLEKIPVWRDEKRRAAEMPKVSDYLKAEEFTEADAQFLSDPRFISVARKAQLYDEAVRNRSEKASQIKNAPAVRPGVAPPKVSPEVQKADVIKQLHQAKDPERRKALLDKALDLKFGLR